MCERERDVKIKVKIIRNEKKKKVKKGWEHIDQTTHIGLNGENTLDDWNILKFELKYNILIFGINCSGFVIGTKCFGCFDRKGMQLTTIVQR